MLVIDRDFLACDCCPKALKTLLITEAVICLSLVDKLLCILHIDALCHTLTLHIRTASAILVRSLIMDKSCFLKSPVDDINSTLHLTYLICILYTQNKITALMLCDQVSIQCCS